MRYAHASAVIRRMQLPISKRSRRKPGAIAVELCTAPGERRELSVVLSAEIFPGEAKRTDVALRRARKRKAIGRGMSRVVEVQRLGSGRIHAHRSRGGHVDQ